MTWFVAAIALLGAILNIKKNRYGFMLWLVSNGYWTIYNLRAGEYAQASIFVCFFGLCIWGLWHWQAESIAQIGSKPWLQNRLRAYEIIFDFQNEKIQALKQQQTGIYNVDGSKAKPVE